MTEHHPKRKGRVSWEVGWEKGQEEVALTSCSRED